MNIKQRIINLKKNLGIKGLLMFLMFPLSLKIGYDSNDFSAFGLFVGVFLLTFFLTKHVLNNINLYKILGSIIVLSFIALSFLNNFLEIDQCIDTNLLMYIISALAGFVLSIYTIIYSDSRVVTED
jgi:hypothetical protein